MPQFSAPTGIPMLFISSRFFSLDQWVLAWSFFYAKKSIFWRILFSTDTRVRVFTNFKNFHSLLRNVRNVITLLFQNVLYNHQFNLGKNNYMN